ncbi:hypothetical protein IQ244_01065 [Nostoc sp. LEGE 06077]|uniref:hypothetical protein n=1 Tax=Nostoc sp. LEGE 06077 TaxID=915325 RepID=UPI001882A679|nr:hypothetical protein [Nostoc sp. LEGE 06077]MBE9205147.1 hypothetical protein [Nostoc sp. LEGE 06077]
MEESAVNPFGAGNPFTGNNGSLPQRSPFDNLSNIGQYIPEGVNNPFTSSSTLPGGINPFASDGGSRFEQLIFNRLKLVLGENFFDGTNTPFTSGRIPQFSGGGNLSKLGTPPFNANNAPVGNGNRNFGTNNATIGNFNSNYGNDSATIGNGNWNFSSNNTTIGNGNWKFGVNNTIIGNGNWHWDDGNNNATLGNGNWQFGQDNQTVGNGNWNFGSDNTTVGNGNWHWDEGSNNTTVGNGNWQFGSENKTLGNGNWDFGTNNIIVGNGNLVFTSGNIIVGNGNLLIDSNNTIIGIGDDAESLSSLFQGTPSDVDSLINSLVGAFGQEFNPLTGNFDSLEAQTFNRLILSRVTGEDNITISNQLEQFFTNLFRNIPFDELPYQPGQNFHPVPEPSASVPLIVSGFLLLLFSKFKQKVLAKKQRALSSSSK